VPELPDVVGFQRYLGSTSLHQKIVRTKVSDRRILDGISAQQLSRHLAGRAFDETARHGKYLFARAGDEGWLVLHFGMTGSLGYYARGRRAPEYARVTLDFANGNHLAYVNKRMLGRVGFVLDLVAYVEAQGLGVDALSRRLSGRMFARLMAGRTGPVKARLMDQSLVAGVGNIYSDEILFQARLHPATDASVLNYGDIKRLYRVMRRVLRVAADKGGDIDKFPRGYFLPRREKGAPCPGCGGQVERIVVVGRSGYFCPQCQKRKQ
jgi:formamidopyrimidine-DNA glycosylase